MRRDGLITPGEDFSFCSSSVTANGGESLLRGSVRRMPKLRHVRAPGKERGQSWGAVWG